MIVENPYTQPHYLTLYFPVKPTIIDRDRTRNGDYYKKPTQYWFLNCDPENNVIFEQLEYAKRCSVEREWQFTKVLPGKRSVRRSMIHPQYARRFIKQFILDGGDNEQITLQ